MKKQILLLSVIVAAAGSARADEYLFIANELTDNVTVVPLAGPIFYETVAVGSLPTGVAVDPEGRFAYVTNYGDDTVSVIDGSAMAERFVVPLSPSASHGPSGIGMHPDGTAWVLHEDGTVYLVAATTTSAVVIAKYPHGLVEPVDVAFDPSGDLAYVIDHDTGELAVLEVATGALLTSQQVAQNPIALDVHSDGRIFVADEPLTASHGAIFVYDLQGTTFNLVGVLNDPSLGLPSSIAVAPSLGGYPGKVYTTDGYVTDIWSDGSLGHLGGFAGQPGDVPLQVMVGPVQWSQILVLNGGNNTVDLYYYSANDPSGHIYTYTSTGDGAIAIGAAIQPGARVGFQPQPMVFQYKPGDRVTSSATLTLENRSNVTALNATLVRTNLGITWFEVLSETCTGQSIPAGGTCDIEVRCLVPPHTVPMNGSSGNLPSVRGTIDVESDSLHGLDRAEVHCEPMPGSGGGGGGGEGGD